MKAYSVPAIIIATICLTLAISDVLAWVRRNKRQSDIAFIFVCLGGMFFCIFCAGEYNVDTPVQSIFWLKGEVIASTISGIALLWFISEETKLVNRKVLFLGMAWAAFAVFSQLIDLGNLTWMAGDPLILRVVLPFGLDFVYQEVSRGPILVLITFAGFGFHIYLLGVLGRYWRRGDPKKALVLICALGFIIVAQIVDFFIGIGVISFVFLLEYAWLATILVVGLKRSNDFVEAAVTRKLLDRTDQELKDSQTTLATIIDSTDDLIWSVAAGTFDLLTFNRAFSDFFQKSRGLTVVPGMNFTDFLDSEADRQEWLGIYQRGFNQGAHSTEYRFGELEKVFLVGVNPLSRGNQVFGLSIFAHDITLRKKAEEQVQRALAEKEVLLREVHHRTKNNMNVIVSILRLQSSEMADQRLKDAFAVSIDRIISMAMVHGRLYMSGDLSRIDLKEYLQELTDRLVSSHALPDQRPHLVYQMDSMTVMIETAINCGMIVNELVTNALKHAFPSGKAGEIKVVLHRGPDRTVVLSVSDNGQGLPENFDPQSHGSLGHRLVHTLARESLEADLEFRSTPGLSCTLAFTLPAEEPVSQVLGGCI